MANTASARKRNRQAERRTERNQARKSRMRTFIKKVEVAIAGGNKEQAAEALRPIAGEFAFTLFAAGIVGTGLLAIPILAGSAAYAVAEAFSWPIGLGRRMTEARGFYTILSIATLLGVAIDFTSIDPIKALFWSAVINGVIAVPIMAVMMLMAGRADIMGRFTAKRRLKVLGWFATVAMAAVVVAMFVTWGK